MRDTRMPASSWKKKNDMATTLHTAQAGANRVTQPSEERMIREHSAASFDSFQVTKGLLGAPRSKSVFGNL
jgi:hypothetical protein